MVRIWRGIVNQSESLSSLPISRNIKSLTWYGYGIIVISTLTPNRTFSVLYSDISTHSVAHGYFGSTKFRQIWTMVRPNPPDMQPKRSKKVGLGTTWYNYPNLAYIWPCQTRRLISWDLRKVDLASDWLIWILGMAERRIAFISHYKVKKKKSNLFKGNQLRILYAPSACLSSVVSPSWKIDTWHENRNVVSFWLPVARTDLPMIYPGWIRQEAKSELDEDQLDSTKETLSLCRFFLPGFPRWRRLLRP